MDNHINGEICIERVYKTGMSEKFYNFYIFFQKKINDIIIYSYQLQEIFMYIRSLRVRLNQVLCQSFFIFRKLFIYLLIFITIKYINKKIKRLTFISSEYHIIMYLIIMKILKAMYSYHFRQVINNFKIFIQILYEILLYEVSFSKKKIFNMFIVEYEVHIFFR